LDAPGASILPTISAAVSASPDESAAGILVPDWAIRSPADRCGRAASPATSTTIPSGEPSGI